MKIAAISEVLIDKISGEWGEEPTGDSAVKVIRTANFTNLGIIDFSKLVFRTIEPKKIEQKHLLSGDVIIEKSGGSPTQPVGRVVYFTNPDNSTYLCNNFTTVLRPNKDVVYPKFLFYVLFYNHLTKKTLRYQNKTTGIINLQLDKYLASEIPLPPLDDQIRIATLLTRAEKLIAKRKESIKALDELLKSTFLEMFGDPVRNEKGWALKKLPQLISRNDNSLKRGPFGGALKKEIFVDDGYLVYEQNHALNNDYSFRRYFINEAKYNELIDFDVKPGDILISCSGVYLGKLSIVPQGALPGIINQALLKVTLNTKEMNQTFFVNVFSNPGFKNKHILANRGSGIPNLPPMPVIKNIDFITPPIDLQNKFAAIVQKVECLKSKYTQNLTELENLYGSLSQRAFKGVLDLSRVKV